MNQKNEFNNKINLFYSIGNGSNDGSIYANKTFHIVYYILKHDFTNKVKTIIGILYNKIDNEKLYFNCIMALKDQFSIPYLLKNIIYKQRYDKYMIKKVLLEDTQTKSILEYADKILMSKVNKQNGNN